MHQVPDVVMGTDAERYKIITIAVSVLRLIKFPLCIDIM